MGGRGPEEDDTEVGEANTNSDNWNEEGGAKKKMRLLLL